MLSHDIILIKLKGKKAKEYVLNYMARQMRITFKEIPKEEIVLQEKGKKEIARHIFEQSLEQDFCSEIEFEVTNEDKLLKEKEAKKKAIEEAAKKAAGEAERKAAENAAKKAAEEAERKATDEAAENAAKKAAEEAERKTAENATKKERKTKKDLSYIFATVSLIVSIVIKDNTLSNILLLNVIIESICISRVAYKITKNEYGYENYLKELKVR